MATRRRAAIERQALDLLQQQGLLSAPIDVQQLARRLNMKVIFKFFEDDGLSGIVFRGSDGVITLGINTLNTEARQRFSVAHEIGHALLHLKSAGNEELFVDPPARVMFRDGSASLGEDRREIEANQFAAGLLMPAPLIREIASKLVASNKSVTVGDVLERLTQRFKVSGQAMRFRLVTLGVIDPE